MRKPTHLPQSAGVYVFRKGTTPLYVGKAANLRNRLGSYFQNGELPAKIRRMLAEATRIEIIKTASEVEALIKEAELIKKYRPKYNLLMRDDKSYFYVGITKEPYPRIFIGHEPRQKALGTRERALGKRRGLVPSAYPLVPRYIGPFTSGGTLRAALKLLRRIFPFCTCGRPHKRPCLAGEIGRCPGYCCLIEVKGRKTTTKRNSREYRKSIQSIVAVLSGERTRLTGRLKREMKDAVRHERYEEAARLRDAIFGLEDVFAHRQVLHTPEARLPDGQARHPWPVLLGRLQSLLKTERDIWRIEGYDISNISGTGATGSMIVFKNGLPDKSQYRKFRIRMAPPPGGGHDTDMHREVLRRRLRHPEWPYPELIVIDGGKPQLNAARSVVTNDSITPISEYSYDRKNTRKMSGRPILVALAKREEILHTEGGRAIPLRRHDPALLHLFQRIRDESHRFARAYHHKLRAKSFKPT